MDLSLERVRKLGAHLPSYTRPTCHIAGTNGKGSVSAILSSILLASSPPLNVGRFNSPHLVSIHDCIVINQGPVEESLYVAARAEVEAVNQEHGLHATSFELLTLTALLVFERHGVDIAVIEVGMGGRLDATNVIPDECIFVSVLTAVDLDHQALLGETVAEIANEKAGIARFGKPFVIGPQIHHQVVEVAASVAGSIGADVMFAVAATERRWDESIDGPEPPSSWRFPPPQPVRLEINCFPDAVRASLPLYGDHQLPNLGVACTIISTLLTHPSCTRASLVDLRERITPSSIARGVRDTRWPGRLSFHSVTLSPSHIARPRPLAVLVDGAHNPASASVLALYLRRLFSVPAQSDDLLGSEAKPQPISLTYIIALSHSPPKTPLQTLSPVLESMLPPHLCVRRKIAVLKFTPPDGMPWVKAVPPSELQRVVLSVVPGVDIWAAPDEEDPKNGQLLRAFEWAAREQDPESQAVVVLFGSLYLVADFYRLLGSGFLLDGS